MSNYDEYKDEETEKSNPSERETIETLVVPEKKQKSAGWLRTYIFPTGSGFIGATIAVLILFQTEIVGPVTAEENPDSTNETAEQSLEATELSSMSGDALIIEDVIESASKSIVGIVNIQQESWQTPTGQTAQSEEGIAAGTGSGVIIDTNEDYTYIVTNNHVTEGANEIEVSLENGETRIGEVVGSDTLTDLSVVQVESSEDDIAMKFGDSSALRVGEEVLAIGNPLGLELSKTVTQGIISAIDRSLEIDTSAGAWDLSVVQTDAAINPGNSGGALINSTGELIGINSLKITDSGIEGLGFAIPSDEVQPIIEELIANGSIARPYLGIGLTDVAEIPPFYIEERGLEVEEGVLITAVEEGSAAQTAGLAVEDIILSIEGEAISNSADLRKSLYSAYSIGDEISITILRDQTEQTVKLTLTSNQVDDEIKIN
ncbi:peptidase S1 [Salipaludibacillus neizhouensis]|uniref:Peptidase S1 n=1 Tax=Salipaludibacillus neizhouensis TaxID=885475 RepID=A0A3A9KHG1_9BACI|nr:trypsin-like peptidase domain-containing protein [Salipaludibacillus neizhouensis]RKL67105.1 peptidase S1 [Salipaludibacillus neizhouensis]